MYQKSDLSGEAKNLVIQRSSAAEFVERCDDLIDQSSRVVIQNDTDQDRAGDLLKLLKDLKKDIEEQRKEDTAPLREAQQEINARYKPLDDKLKAAICRVNNGMVHYSEEQHRLEQQRREEEALAKAEDDPDHADAYLDAGSKEVKPTTTRSTHGARTHMQTRLDSIEVEDWSKVPEEYKMLDEKKAKGAIRAGVEIPGVKAHYKTTAVSR